jgi:hypothetical protein
MKVFSRIGFVSLTAGAFGLPVAILIPNSEIADKFAFTGFFSLFGLQIWSAIFFKSEPNFARTGVIIVTLIAAVVWFYALFIRTNKF